MSQDEIVEDTKRKLNELEQEIQAARTAPGASERIAGQAAQDWQAMVESHAAISRKLDATDNHSAAMLEGVRLDIDVLRNSFDRWMARVEGKYAEGAKDS